MHIRSESPDLVVLVGGKSKSDSSIAGAYTRGTEFKRTGSAHWRGAVHSSSYFHRDRDIVLRHDGERGLWQFIRGAGPSTEQGVIL